MRHLTPMTMTYNTLGQITKSTDPDLVSTVYGYNTRGERTASAIDLDGNGAITYGTDTVQFTETVPATGTINGVTGPVWKTTSKVWQDGDTSSTGGTPVSTSLRAANGLSSSSQSVGVSSPSISVTALSATTAWTATQTNPDGSETVSSYEAGLLRSTAVRDSSNALIDSVTYDYDSLNRITFQTDLRRESIGIVPANFGPGAYTSIITRYLSATADFVHSSGEPVNLITKYTYDIRGRRITTDAPDTLDADGAPLLNITNTAYFPDSTVQENSGAQTYRTTHTYDYADRMKTLTTYRTATDTSTTTWTYSTDRGFLTRKQYADGNGTNYDYTSAGRLASRTWGRSSVALPSVTTYGYDSAGRLTSTDYSDPTPDVAISYDALGRPLSQSNGIATSAFAYDPATLATDTETITYNIPGQASFSRVIDRSRDNLNRPTGFELKNGATVETSASYTYDTAGRL
jgi:YD repeat-containing protein